MDTVVVTTPEQVKEALDAGYTPAQMLLQSADTEGLVARARNEAYAAGHAAGHAAGTSAERAEGEQRWAGERSRLLDAATSGTLPEARAVIVASERNRITSIQALTERGLEGLAATAIADGLSVEQFAVAQLWEMKDRGITMDAVHRDAPPAAPFAAAPNDERTVATTKSSASSIFSRRKRDAGAAT